MNRIKTAVIALLCCFGVAFTVPQKSQATGIPVVDIANLAQAILQIVQQLEEIEEAAEMVENAKETLTNIQDLLANAEEMLGVNQEQLAQLQEYLSLYKEARAEWLALVGRGDFTGLLGMIGTGLDKSIVADMEEPGVETAAVFGTLDTQARRMYDKNIEFTHSTITKINEIHENISNRHEKIKSLAAKTDSAETEKALLVIQCQMQAEQLAMANEQQEIAALQLEYQLGLRALDLEENAAIHIRPE